MAKNYEEEVVKDFGIEWNRFNQSELTDSEREIIFNQYFCIFPFHKLPKGAVGADIGSGSGRWAVLVALQVGVLHCVEPSEAINVAKNNLKNLNNIKYHNTDVGNLPFADETLDFAYSLGVLHHIPNTQIGIQSIAKKLKKGAPLLLYLYYAFDNRPLWFKILWRISDFFRNLISRLPNLVKNFVCDLIAALVYFPIARFGLLLDKIKKMPKAWPLSYYRDRDFYVMRTDSLDRFGTRLEHRFTKEQIEDMMVASNLIDIKFSDSQPYWTVIGYKKF